MLSQFTPLDEIIRTRYQAQFSQLEILAWQVEFTTATNCISLMKEKWLLDIHKEVLGAQLRILVQAQAVLPLSYEKIFLLKESYQTDLQQIKEDAIEGYKVFLAKEDLTEFTDAKTLEKLTEQRRNELSTLFQTKLNEIWNDYQAFQVMDEDKNSLSKIATSLKNSIDNIDNELIAIDTQVAAIVELASERKDFLGAKQRILKAEQEAAAKDPHFVFITACINGDLVKVKNCVEQIKNSKQRLAFINKLGLNNRNALHQACGNGHYVIVNYLLQQGANPRLADSEDYTALHYAALKPSSCTETIFEILCRAGLQLDMTGPYGRTALHTAALFNNLPAVNWLLQRGANPNAIEKDESERDKSARRTPLHNAAFKGHTKIVERLLATNANPVALNAKNETPLFEALLYGQEGVARAIAERRIGLSYEEKKELLALLPDMFPAARHALINFLQLDNELYQQAAALNADYHPPLQLTKLIRATMPAEQFIPPLEIEHSVSASTSTGVAKLAASMSSVFKPAPTANAPLEKPAEEMSEEDAQQADWTYWPM